jgi:hypothetical protein
MAILVFVGLSRLAHRYRGWNTVTREPRIITYALVPVGLTSDGPMLALSYDTAPRPGPNRVTRIFAPEIARDAVRLLDLPRPRRRFQPSCFQIFGHLRLRYRNY